jgi:CelD/BcsL family acetyltransferase involved in cellulose biosynthesis
VKVDIRILRDAEGLRAIEPQWEALAADAAEPNPFYEPWLLLPALEAYGTESFRCVAVWQDGTLSALFPLRLEKRFRGIPVGAARSWLHRNMLVGTPLVRAKNAAASIDALLRSRVAPVIEFEWSSAGGLFYGALAEAASDGGFPWLVSDAYMRAVLVRSRDPRSRFNSNMKNNLRRWQAKLAAAGRVTPVRLAPGDDIGRWTEEFIRLEASGWKGQRGSAIACRPDDRRFVTAAFAEGFRRGQLILTGLDLDGRPLARHSMLVGGEGAFTFKIAYDETHAAASPGILAEADNVRQFLEHAGPCWIDSNTARENTSYGRVWKDRRTVQRVAVGAHGAGRLAVAALPLVRLIKHALRGGKVKHESTRAPKPALQPRLQQR